MKKMLLVSLFIYSSGLLGKVAPKNHPVRRPLVRIERQHNHTAARVPYYRSPQQPQPTGSRLPQTPANSAMAHSMQQAFYRDLNRAAQVR